MKRNLFCKIFVIGLGLCIITGCGARQSAPTSSDSLTVDEARAILSEFKVANGVKGVTPPPAPTSISDVLSALKSDDLSRFESCRQFMAGKQGLDALYIRSMLELSWAGTQLASADMLKEFAAKKTAEAKQLEDRQAQGISLTEPEDIELSRLKTRIGQLEEAAAALAVLADVHLVAGTELALETVRQFPQKSQGYVVKAYSHRLKGEWKMFSAAMKKAEDMGEGANHNIRFQRAMEKVSRFKLVNEGREDLETLQVDVPDWVRIQAVLVLVQDDIVHAHEELEELRSVSPGHVVVHLLGSSIDDEFNTAKALRP